MLAVVAGNFPLLKTKTKTKLFIFIWPCWVLALACQILVALFGIFHCGMQDQLPTTMLSILFWVDSGTFRVMEELRLSLVTPKGTQSHSVSVYLESSITLSLLSLPWCYHAASREYCWCFLPVIFHQPWKTNGLATLFPPSFANHQTWTLLFKMKTRLCIAKCSLPSPSQWWHKPPFIDLTLIPLRASLVAFTQMVKNLYALQGH